MNEVITSGVPCDPATRTIMACPHFVCQSLC